MKISIVGMGRVGSTQAYTLVMRGLCDELVLVSRRIEVAEGEASDLRHALSFTNKPMRVVSGDPSASVNSDIVIIAASVPVDPAITSRNALAVENTRLFESLIPELAQASPNAILIVVTNPVDVLTWHAKRLSGFDARRVMGTGTLIDSARLRSMLSTTTGIHPDDVRAYILGEHGHLQFPAFSIAQAGGVKLTEEVANMDIFRQAVEAGEQVFRLKGYTNFAISMAVGLIVDSIVHDACRTMPVTVPIEDFLGVSDVCLSVPVVIGRAGVTQVLRPVLNDEEIASFRQAADAVRRIIDQTTM